MASSQQKEKIVILKRLNVIHSDEQCQLLTFSDITTWKTLEVEQAKTESLKLINRSVSHEMLGPLMANVCIAKLLLQTILNQNQI